MEATKHRVLGWIYSMDPDFPALSGHGNCDDHNLKGKICCTQDRISDDGNVRSVKG